MLIRSQDKKTVVNTGDLTMFVYKKNENCHCICTERCEELGSYKTECTVQSSRDSVWAGA